MAPVLAESTMRRARASTPAKASATCQGATGAADTGCSTGCSAPAPAKAKASAAAWCESERVTTTHADYRSKRKEAGGFVDGSNISA